MPVMINWIVPQKVVYAELSGDITRDDLAYLSETLHGGADPSAASAHQIFDISKMTKSPTLSELRQNMTQNSDQHGYIVIVGDVNPVLRFAIRSIAQMGNFRIKISPTLDEAFEQLRAIEPMLGSYLPSRVANEMPLSV